MEPVLEKLTVQDEQIKMLSSVTENSALLKKFYQNNLKVDQDYGTIPGVLKPCLYKPGAEKIRLLLNLGIEITRTGETILFEPQPFYDCSYKATIRNNEGRILAECEGSCNTAEDKYRFIYQFREGIRPDPNDPEILNLQKLKMGRWKNVDGLQHWQDKIINPNVLALKNTIQKMSQKRSYVGGILVASGASSLFTQDLKGDDEISEDSVSEAIEGLSAIASTKDLQEYVLRYEKIYNSDTQFTKAAKELKEKLTKKK